MTVTVGEILVFLSLWVLVWQTYLLRKDINQRTIQELYSRWLQSTMLEMKYPSYHRMVVSKETLETIRNLHEDELRARAFAWFVFDTLALAWTQTKAGRLSALRDAFMSRLLRRSTKTWHTEIERSIRRTASNPTLSKAWLEWGLRDEFEGSTFQHLVDEVIADQSRKDLQNAQKVG